MSVQIHIKSLIFNIFFFTESVLIASFFVPFYFINKKYMISAGKCWAQTALWGLKHICNLSYKIEGSVPEKPVIIASKHQSTLECLIFWEILQYPNFILKKELLKIPFVGMYFKMMDMIVIDRAGLKETALRMSHGVQKSIVNGRSVILFPEGTRTSYGEKTKCKAAIALIQKENLIADICPVVLNTGKFWKRNSFLRYPGQVVIKFLPLIDKSINYREINNKLDEILDEVV